MIRRIFDTLPVDRKFSGESLWNVSGLFISGLSGLALQFLVASRYDPSVLGILNMTIVILTIYSQISGFGIHFSVLKHVPEHSGNTNAINDIMASSFLLTFVISIFFTLIFISLNYTAEGFLKDKGLIFSLFKAVPVFILFPLNKVAMAYLNGLRRMKIYAVYNSLRYILWLLFACIVTFYFINPDYFPYIFPVSEGILFLLLIPFSLRSIRSIRFAELKTWNKINFIHGYKSVLGTIFADMGTRADVLILGAFTSNYTVGIYSLASVVMDGFSQFSITFRTLVNPVITKSFINDDTAAFRQKLIKGKKLYYILVLPLGILMASLFPVAVAVFNLNDEYRLAFIPLLIMLGGFLLTSGYHPFQMIFNQTGHPGVQTLFFGLVLISNTLLNLLLIPYAGLYGAALSTSLTLMLVPVYMNQLSKKTLGFAF